MYPSHNDIISVYGVSIKSSLLSLRIPLPVIYLFHVFEIIAMNKGTRMPSRLFHAVAFVSWELLSEYSLTWLELQSYIIRFSQDLHYRALNSSPLFSNLSCRFFFATMNQQ